MLQMQISKGAVAFMFESSRSFTITDCAMKNDKKHKHEPKKWGDLVDNFPSHKIEAESILGKKKSVDLNLMTLEYGITAVCKRATSTSTGASPV